MDDEQAFSPEYNLGNQTQSDTPSTPPDNAATANCDQIIDSEHYEISKPKRIIIKAEIINDKD